MSEFTWGDVIDQDISKDGIAFLYGVGSQRAIQKFCEDISNLIGYKCDWSYAAGRFRMKVLPEGLDAVRVALENNEWVQRYVRPLSQQSIEDGTADFDNYFEPYILPCAQNFPEDAEEAMKKEENDCILVEQLVTHKNEDGTSNLEVVVHKKRNKK